MSSSRSAVPAEQRLFSLVLALVASPVGVTKRALLSSVYGYADKFSFDGGNESLDRQFERDKESLRSLGIVIDTIDSPLEPGNNQLARYRISKQELEFPEGLQFSARELMLLRLAAHAWSVGSLSDEARRATMKLEALGSGLDVRQLGVAPMLGVAEPSGAALQRAIDEGRSVTFDYLLPGRERAASRTVAPLRLHRADGRWHLISWDLERDDGRVFLLSRIRSAVTMQRRTFAPELRAHADALVTGLLSQSERHHTIIETAHGSTAEARLAPRGNTIADKGVRRLDVATLDLHEMADEIAGYGADAVVVEPRDLRDLVIARLRRVAAAHTGSSSAPDFAPQGAAKRVSRRENASIAAPDHVTLLLSIIGYLREHDEVAVDELARVFGVSPDRLEQRIIPFLGMAGVPGDTGTYQHEDLFDIDWQALHERRVVRLIRTVAIEEAPRFAPNETAALIAGLQTLVSVLPEEDGQLARATAAKLGAALGEHGTATAMSVSEEVQDPSLPTIVSAIEDRAWLTFQYRDAADRVTERTVRPTTLQQESGAWYVRGLCRERGAERTFRVDRMRALRRMDGGSTDEDEQQTADLSRAKATAVHEQLFDIIATMPAHSLHRFAGFSPEIVSEEFDGRVRVRIEAWHTGAAVRLVQQAPGEVTVEHPEETRMAVREWADRALAAYGA